MEEKKLNKPWLDLQRMVKEGLKCAKVHLCLYRSKLKFPGTVLPELRSEPIFCKELPGRVAFQHAGGSMGGLAEVRHRLYPAV